jgi:serine/threonine-protein kinase
MSRDIENSLLGRELGPYELVDVVGTGPYGSVFRARDLKQVGAWRAVKVMLGPIADLTPFKFRLPNEMRAAIQLTHPHIVPVYQFGSDEGRQYVAMEFVESVSLADYVRTLPQERRYNDPAVHRSLRAIGQALEYAHGQRVVHANVCPTNILLRSADGHAVLTDFCVARAVAIDRIAEAGLAIDCAYRSPEQCASPPGDLTPASDIYSLAAVLWYIATGEPPFGSGMEARARHVSEAPPAFPPGAASLLPPELREVLVRSLAKAPGTRHQRAGQLIADFIAAATPAPRPQPPPPPPPPLPVLPPPVPVTAAPNPALAAAQTTITNRQPGWRVFQPATAGPAELRDTPLWRPYPSEVQEPRPRTGPPVWLLGLLAGLVVVALVVLLVTRLPHSEPGSAARNGPTNAPTTVPTAQTQRPPTSRLPAPVTGAVGSPLTVSGLRITVQGTGPDTRGVAAPGQRLLAVQVLYENTGRGRAAVSPYDWAVTDAAGNVYSAVIPGLSTDLPERQLPSGGESRGTIDFAVPPSATGLVLHYAAEVGDATAVIALS